MSKKKDHHQEKGARDVTDQSQVSKTVEVLGGVGERNPRRGGEADARSPKKGNLPVGEKGENEENEI